LIRLGAAGTLHPAAFGRCPHPVRIPPGWPWLGSACGSSAEGLTIDQVRSIRRAG